jgi:hypothetical protein
VFATLNAPLTVSGSAITGNSASGLGAVFFSNGQV